MAFANGTPLNGPERLVSACLFHTGFNSDEPTIGLARGDILVAPAWPFAGSTAFGGIARSADNGSTWRAIYPFTGNPGVPSHPETLDPFLYVDPATGRAFLDDYVGAGSSFSWSDDAGTTCHNTVAGAGETDHQMIFSAHPKTSTTMGYPNAVYRCAYAGGATGEADFSFSCAKSLDGGTTFLPPGTPATFPLPDDGNYHLPGYCSGGLDHGIADSQGILHVSKDYCGHPWLAVSADEGLTWQTHRVSSLPTVEGSGEKISATSVAIDTSDNLYYAWIGLDRLAHLAISNDHGMTWSNAFNITAPGMREVAFLNVAAGQPGSLAISYLASRNSPRTFLSCVDPTSCAPLLLGSTSGGKAPAGYANTTWDAFLGYTTSALQDPPLIQLAMLNDPHDPLIRGACEPGNCVAKDFLDLKLGPDGSPWSTYIDACMDQCPTGDSSSPTHIEAAVGHLVGMPDLWPAASPSGPYLPR